MVIFSLLEMADVVAIDDLTCHSLNGVDAFVKPSSVYWWRNGEPQFARQHGYQTVHVEYRHTYTSMIMKLYTVEYIYIFLYMYFYIYIYTYIHVYYIYHYISHVTCLYTHYGYLPYVVFVRDPYSMQARNILAAFCHTQGCRAKEEPATPAPLVVVAKDTLL